MKTIQNLCDLTKGDTQNSDIFLMSCGLFMQTLLSEPTPDRDDDDDDEQDVPQFGWIPVENVVLGRICRILQIESTIGRSEPFNDVTHEFYHVDLKNGSRIVRFFCPVK